jgi:hypothetical protein
MSQPLLDFGDVGVMFERVGRGRSVQGVRAEAIDFDINACGILGQHLVHAAWCDCAAGATGKP